MSRLLLVTLTDNEGDEVLTYPVRLVGYDDEEKATALFREMCMEVADLLDAKRVKAKESGDGR